MTDTSITTCKDVYDVLEKHERGQFANVYRAVRKSDGLHVALKIASDKRYNDLIKHEHATLTHLSLTIDGRPFITEPLDNFTLEGRDATVFEFETDRFTVAEVAASLGTLTHQQVVWMYDRLLVGLSHVHREGLVHGAVLPEHVFVPPSAERWVGLVDWCYATEAGSRLRAVCPDARPFYPPEVLAKAPVTPATDLYMATKTVLLLLGVDPLVGELPASIPMRLQKLLAAGIHKSPAARPSDVGQLVQELRQLCNPCENDFHRLDLPATR